MEQESDEPAPATRIVTPRSTVLALAGAGAPFMVAAFDVIEGMALLGSSVGGAVVGWVSGRVWPASHCSACTARLAPADSECPDCHASLADDQGK